LPGQPYFAMATLSAWLVFWSTAAISAQSAFSPRLSFSIAAFRASSVEPRSVTDERGSMPPAARDRQRRSIALHSGSR